MSNNNSINSTEYVKELSRGKNLSEFITVSQSLTEKQKEERELLSSVSLWASILMLIIFVMSILSSYVFLPIKVIGSSMYPTLRTQEMLIANRCVTPNRGDIVVISGIKFGSSDLLIKRVIAKEGDTVELISGKVMVNGELLNEPYAYGVTHTFNGQNDYEKIIVGDGEIYYLGDNRENSNDSRTYGVCKESQIVGVVESWSVWLTSLFRFS